MNVSEEKNKTVSDWVDTYSDELFSWAFHKTSSIEIAEDIVQDTFLSAFNSFEKFNQKSKPKTWLIAILNNKIIDYYRKKANAHSSLDQMTETQGNHITDSLFDENGRWKKSDTNPNWDSEKNLLDDKEFNTIMAFCMGDLPEKWKIAISSKYLFGKKADETCQELRLTTSNYWQIIHRAKLLLKVCIEKHWSK